MRRTASQVIRELENRIARLERQASTSSELDIILEKILDTIKRGHGENTFTIEIGNQTFGLPDYDYGFDKTKDVLLESFNIACVYLDEATTPSICSRIKNKDPRLIAELNKYFREGSNSSKIIKAMEKRGAKDYLGKKLRGLAHYRNNRSYEDRGYIEVEYIVEGDLGQPEVSYETIGGRCRLRVMCRLTHKAWMHFEPSGLY